MMKDGNDWVSRLCESFHTPLPVSPPAYWQHNLIRHLELPDEWPVDWSQVSVRDRGFTLYLEFFDPPANLTGLAHLLVPLRFIIAAAIKELGDVQEDALDLFEQFIETVSDFIDHATEVDRTECTANKLTGISQLGVWRFHFYCSQVVRDKIDNAITLKAENRLVNLSKLEFLQDGRLDPIYCSLALPFHHALRRRQKFKQKHYEKLKQNDEKLEEGCSERHIIYTEALACEHSVLLGHKLISNWATLDNQKIAKELKRKMRSIVAEHKEGLRRKRQHMMEDAKGFPLDNESKLLKSIEPSIVYAFRLLSTFGAYHPKGRGASKTKEYRVKHSSRVSRLLPEGIYEESETSDLSVCFETAEVDKALNLLDGLLDDESVSAPLERRYGIKPKVATDMGESREDYLSPDHVEIPVSWLMDPFRNAIKQRVQAESLITHQEPPVWSSACLRIQSLKTYISISQDAELALQVLASLTLHSGLNDTQLGSIRIGKPPIFEKISHPKDCSPEEYSELNHDLGKIWKDIFIDPNSGYYQYLLPDNISAYFDQPCPVFANQCRSSSKIVRIPIPSELSSDLQTWVDRIATKRGSLDPVNEHQPGTYLKLFRDWKRLSTSWQELMAETGRMADENITPSRLSATFRSLYVGQMGLSPLYANLIQRRFPLQYRAQHFYANLNLSDLQERFCSACTGIHHLLAVQDD